MSSMVLCKNFIFNNPKLRRSSFYLHRNSSTLVAQLGDTRRKFAAGFIPNAGKRKRERSWWQRFFFDEDGNWLGLKEDDMLVEAEDDLEMDGSDEGEKFEAWKTRAEAIVELREAQQDMTNEENRKWEDWLADSNSTSWEAVQSDPTQEKGLLYSLTDFVLRKEDDDDDDMLYEDRVFRYASLNSAKFLAVLIIIPWALDFVVHDYLLMPFLDRYVKTVPLAAEMLDVRRNQKLQMVEELKIERARFHFEMEIGKSPPLSDEEVWWELRHKALELRDEWRLENRKAFANIWSDMIFGVSLFILLYCNQSKVALLKFTGYKIINNISDTGKAFLIILITDIFLGYHSESGWQTLLEILVEHYGIDVDQSAITIFICLIPVVIDACVKLWLFKFLPRLSPKVANIFREMKRH
ncbi:PREDICTED: chloroplast envelope membrane [Prunus dulcis]|uniref:PREDICTED: chloroplast envelope membrane n=1 Tax=Prunus dulcis TaxID=3755 RepID=A0A5E4FHN9_PRUDU|nr:chloroplast envelope membrane protein [Prunus dulcis]VVA26161.1 PREDICTED: chloroplast envelope membrane [Prunus dulcis]